MGSRTTSHSFAVIGWEDAVLTLAAAPPPELPRPSDELRTSPNAACAATRTGCLAYRHAAPPALLFRRHGGVLLCVGKGDGGRCEAVGSVGGCRGRQTGEPSRENLPLKISCLIFQSSNEAWAVRAARVRHVAVRQEIRMSTQGLSAGVAGRAAIVVGGGDTAEVVAHIDTGGEGDLKTFLPNILKALDCGPSLHMLPSPSPRGWRFISNERCLPWGLGWGCCCCCQFVGSQKDPE